MKFFNFLKSKTKINSKETKTNSTLYREQGLSKTNEKFLYYPTTTLSDVLDFVRNNSNELGIYLNNGASDIEIDNFEQNRMALPDDFKLLYKLANGFETDEDIFRLIPLDEILTREKDDDYLISDNSFHFTEYMIYCDMWTVEIDPQNKNDYKIYNKADDVVFLTNSIAEFLATFIDKGIYDGLYQWREDIKSKTH